MSESKKEEEKNQSGWNMHAPSPEYCVLKAKEHSLGFIADWCAKADPALWAPPKSLVMKVDGKGNTHHLPP